MEELHKWGQYTRNLADAIGLRDWTFRVDYAPLDNPGHRAEVERTYGRKCATILIHDDFLQSSPEDQAQTIAHELLHCHIGGMQDHASLLRESLPSGVFAVWHPLFEWQVELAVDALADVIALAIAIPMLRFHIDHVALQNVAGDVLHEERVDG